MKKIVIVGCGKLGNIVADAILNGLLPEYELVGVYSRTHDKAQALANKMENKGKNCIVANTMDELLQLQPDYLVEAA